MAEPAKVFLSHAQEDETEVEYLYDQLSQNGMKPWMSKRDIIAGEDWERSILRAMRAADFLLVCLSLRAVAKGGFLQKEIKQALRMWEEKLEDDIYLIPVRLEDCHVADALARFQWVDLLRHPSRGRTDRAPDDCGSRHGYCHKTDEREAAAHGNGGHCSGVGRQG